MSSRRKRRVFRSFGHLQQKFFQGGQGVFAALSARNGCLKTNEKKKKKATQAFVLSEHSQKLSPAQNHVLVLSLEPFFHKLLHKTPQKKQHKIQ